MRSLILLNAGLASASALQGPLFTVDDLISFGSKSVFLGKEIVSSGSSVLFKATYDMIPPDQQKLVGDLYSDAYEKVEKLRAENGVPSAAELTQKATVFYTESVQPPMSKAFSGAKTALQPVELFAGALIKQFEAVSPDCAGLLPTDIFSLFAVIAYLLLILFYVCLPILSMFCCCCSCKKRAPVVEAPKKQNGKTDLKTKKKQ